MNFLRKNFINISLVFLLIGFYYLSQNYNQIVLGSMFDDYKKEFSIVEISQAVIIFLNLVFCLKNKFLFTRIYNKVSFYLKILILSFLLYEELSFLTTDNFSILQSINRQSELNIHNLRFLRLIVFENISFFKNNLFINDIHLNQLIFIFSLLIIGFGSYITKLSKFKFLFLEKKYSLHSQFYFLNLILSVFILGFFNPNIDLLTTPVLFDSEFVELFTYIIFFLDTLCKKNSLLTKNELIK